MKQLPNWLTAIRIILVIPIVMLMHSESYLAALIATILFTIAAITDYFDGYFARQQKVESTFGKIMDPVADKTLVAASLIMLIEQNKISGLLVILFLSRDFLIGGVRTAAASRNLIISAKTLGKWKTGVQMVCIPFLILSPTWFGLPLPEIAKFGLWLSLLLSLASGVQYLLIYFKEEK